MHRLQQVANQRTMLHHRAIDVQMRQQRQALSRASRDQQSMDAIARQGLGANLGGPVARPGVRLLPFPFIRLCFECRTATYRWSRHLSRRDDAARTASSDSRLVFRTRKRSARSARCWTDASVADCGDAGSSASGCGPLEGHVREGSGDLTEAGRFCGRALCASCVLSRAY